MTRTASLITLTTSFVLLAAGTAYAESRTEVNVENNTGSNTVCVNGKCTTTDSSSNGKSTVCVNGKCFDGNNGNVDYESSDGNTRVKITNNNSNVNVTQNADGEKSVDVESIKPTIEHEVKAAKDEIEAKKQEAQAKVKEVTGFDIMSYIKAELEEIKNFFSLNFLFGNKN